LPAGGTPGWQPDPTTDREFECSGGQLRGSDCPVLD
jgi:hypothetical protein